MTPRLLVAGLTALGLIGLAGCDGRPRAPALKDEPVYQNGREGFRFLVPEGWIQSTRGEAPPGPLTQEQVLVEYQLLGAEQPASFRVTCIDLPAGKDLAEYLTQRFPGEKWRAEGAAEPFTADGVQGVRAVQARSDPGGPIHQEVFAFRRDGRVYLFSGVFAAADAKAKQQVLRAVESLRWKR